MNIKTTARKPLAYFVRDLSLIEQTTAIVLRNIDYRDNQ